MAADEGSALPAPAAALRHMLRSGYGWSDLQAEFIDRGASAPVPGHAPVDAHDLHVKVRRILLEAIGMGRRALATNEEAEYLIGVAFRRALLPDGRPPWQSLQARGAGGGDVVARGPRHGDEPPLERRSSHAPTRFLARRRPRMWYDSAGAGVGHGSCRGEGTLMRSVRSSVRTSWLAKSAGLVLSLFVFASSAFAQPAAWDQKAVTAIAVKLEQSLRDLDRAVRRNPTAQVGSPLRRAQFQARESLRLLMITSRRLATQLRAGEDLDATLPTFRRLKMLRRDAERAGRRANIPGPTLERIVSAQALIDQLMPFYGQAEAEEEAAEQAAPGPEAAPAAEPTRRP
jgi:hypothetical protein